MGMVIDIRARRDELRESALKLFAFGLFSLFAHRPVTDKVTSRLPLEHKQAES
jgi:hypothetical protein